MSPERVIRKGGCPEHRLGRKCRFRHQPTRPAALQSVGALGLNRNVPAAPIADPVRGCFQSSLSGDVDEDLKDG